MWDLFGLDLDIVVRSLGVASNLGGFEEKLKAALIPRKTKNRKGQTGIE